MGRGGETQSSSRGGDGLIFGPLRIEGKGRCRKDFGSWRAQRLSSSPPHPVALPIYEVKHVCMTS